MYSTFNEAERTDGVIWIRPSGLKRGRQRYSHNRLWIGQMWLFRETKWVFLKHALSFFISWSLLFWGIFLKVCLLLMHIKTFENQAWIMELHIIKSCTSMIKPSLPKFQYDRCLSYTNSYKTTCLLLLHWILLRFFEIFEPLVEMSLLYQT